MFFGSKTAPLVLDNLCPQEPCTSVAVIVARCTLVVDVFFTFPLIMAPVYEILELTFFKSSYQARVSNKAIQDRDTEESLSYKHNGNQETVPSVPCTTKEAHWKKMILRTFLLFCVGILGIAVPNITELLALVTGFTLTFNGFIIAPLCHIKLMYKRGQVYGISGLLLIWWDAFLILAGTGLGGWTTYLAISCLKHPNGPTC